MTHRQQVLLVEDNEGNEAEIKYWLKGTYHIDVAHSLTEAKTRLLNNHYHILIVDINLDEENELNKDGYLLMEWIATEPSLEGLPCIVITAYDRGDLAIEGYNGKLPPIAGWVKKLPNYKGKLVETVKNTFSKSVHINFALVYDADSEDLLPPMAGHIEWPEGEEKPNAPMLVDEIRDLIGESFRDAARVDLQELTKGLSGAAVIKVRAKWNSAYGPSCVLKISRRDKIRTEFKNYEKCVARLLPPNTASNAQVVYAGHLGAIQYNFAEDANKPLSEFDEFFRLKSVAQVQSALHSLFRETCRYWYKSPQSESIKLIALYYDALSLSDDKLTSRIGHLLPEFDPAARYLTLPDEPSPLLNALFWVRQNFDSCKVEANHCISHGDLTGRNVFVNEHGHCWLIDFYRTGSSHMLRDHAILETDIKYRLLPELFQNKGRPEAYTRAEYEHMEQALCSGQLPDDNALSPEVAKATAAVLTIRQLAEALMARHHDDAANIRHQILISRLITHLNVTRLRHIEPRHKLWALATAGHICEELDQLPPPR